jgi:drug/metabolite transporter (DMT)-like permease
MDKLIFIGLFIFGVFLSSCAQILLKKSANMGLRGIKMYLNRNVVAGYAIFFGITMLTVILYRYINFSTGVLLESASYVFVPALSYFFMKERLNKMKLIGSVLIISGIIIYIVWA